MCLIKPLPSISHVHALLSTTTDLQLSALNPCMQRRCSISLLLQSMHCNGNTSIPGKLHPRLLHPMLPHTMHCRYHMHCTQQRQASHSDLASNNPNVITRKQSFVPAINTPEPVTVNIFHLCDNRMTRKA
jgi:hypothetical protein